MWENIQKASVFDPTARAIFLHGAERVEKKFFAKVSKEESGCWSFSGTKSENGYSLFSVYNKNAGKGARRYAHRVSALIHGLELVPGMVLDHKCRNRYCVNPEHLRQISRTENVMCGAGISPTNFKKDHCKNGHEFTKENTYVNPKNHRGCRICRRMWMMDFYQRKARVSISPPTHSLP